MVNVKVALNDLIVSTDAQKLRCLRSIKVRFVYVADSIPSARSQNSPRNLNWRFPTGRALVWRCVLTCNYVKLTLCAITETILMVIDRTAVNPTSWQPMHRSSGTLRDFFDSAATKSQLWLAFFGRNRNNTDSCA